jgi:hypothetical protein
MIALILRPVRALGRPTCKFFQTWDMVGRKANMKTEWLQENETVLGDWPVYIGEPSPNSSKITGRLQVTDRRAVFTAGLDLAENAGPEIMSRKKAYKESDALRTFPFDQIHMAEIVKKKLIHKSLLLTLKSGEQIDFQFGAASPANHCNLNKFSIKSR